MRVRGLISRLHFCCSHERTEEFSMVPWRLDVMAASFYYSKCSGFCQWTCKEKIHFRLPFKVLFHGWLALVLLGGSTSGEKLGIGQTAYSIVGKQKMKKGLKPLQNSSSCNRKVSTKPILQQHPLGDHVFNTENFRSVVLNLLVVTPFGSRTTLSQGSPKTIYISDIYTTIHHNSKITAMK